MFVTSPLTYTQLPEVIQNNSFFKKKDFSQKELRTPSSKLSQPCRNVLPKSDNAFSDLPKKWWKVSRKMNFPQNIPPDTSNAVDNTAKKFRHNLIKLTSILRRKWNIKNYFKQIFVFKLLLLTPRKQNRQPDWGTFAKWSRTLRKSSNLIQKF